MIIAFWPVVTVICVIIHCSSQNRDSLEVWALPTCFNILLLITKLNIEGREARAYRH